MGNLGTVGFLLNFLVGEEELFLLVVVCSAPHSVVGYICLAFLLPQVTASLYVLYSRADEQFRYKRRGFSRLDWSLAALGKGEMTPAASLLCWQFYWCVGESVSSCSITGTYCWSGHHGRRGCSPTTPTLGEWSWLVDGDTSAYPLFFKSILEEKKSSAQVGDFIIHISGTSAGAQLLVWCHTFLTAGLLAWERPFLSLHGSVVSFHPVCSLVLWRGAGAAGGEQSSCSTLFQGMALELSRYSNSAENILLKPECRSKQTSLGAAKACGFLPCLAHAVFVCGGNSCLMYWQMY